MTVFNSFKYNSLTNELIFKSTKQKHPSVANILVLFRIQGEFLHLSSLQLFFFFKIDSKMYNSFSSVLLILKHSVLKYYYYPVLPTYIRVKLSLKNLQGWNFQCTLSQKTE